MKQDISKLYKYLAMVESNRERMFAMQDRRREVLEPILSEINPKAYEVQTIEIEVELSDVFSTMFDVKYENIRAQTKAPKKQEIMEMNTLGKKSIKLSEDVIEIILKKEDKYEYVQAVFNIRLSMGRIYSKLYDKDRALQIKYLEQSFRQYEKLKEFF